MEVPACKPATSPRTQSGAPPRGAPRPPADPARPTGAGARGAPWRPRDSRRRARTPCRCRGRRRRTGSCWLRTPRPAQGVLHPAQPRCCRSGVVDGRPEPGPLLGDVRVEAQLRRRPGQLTGEPRLAESRLAVGELHQPRRRAGASRRRRAPAATQRARRDWCGPARALPPLHWRGSPPPTPGSATRAPGPFGGRSSASGLTSVPMSGAVWLTSAVCWVLMSGPVLLARPPLGHRRAGRPR